MSVGNTEDLTGAYDIFIEKMTYSLAVSTTGSGSVSISPVKDEYLRAEKVTLTANPSAHFILDTWSGLNASSTPVYTGNTVEFLMPGNTAVTAVFEQNEYEVTADVRGSGGTVDDINGYYNVGQTVSVEASPATGYVLSRWYNTDDDDSTALENEVTVVDHDIDVRVEFDLIQCTLTIADAANGSVTASPVSANGIYDYGTEITLTAAADDQYELIGWQGVADPNYSQTTYTFTITGDTAISAVFEQIGFEVNGSVVGDVGGTLVYEDKYYQANDVVQLTAVPAAGYQVKAWTGTDDDSSTALTNALTITGDADVAVEFELIEYSLDVTVVGNGSLSALNDTYHYGDIVDITVTPADDYKLVSWVGTNDDSSTEFTNQVTITDDTTVTVNLELVPLLNYAIAGDIAGGVIPQTSGSYDLDQTVELNVTLEEGYIVKRWYGTDNDLSNATTNTVKMSAHKDVTVEIAKEQTPGVCLIKAGARRGLDVFALTGQTDVTKEQLASASSVNISIWSKSGFSFDAALTYDPARASRGLLSIVKVLDDEQHNGEILNVLINSLTGSYRIIGSRFDLTGVSAPLVLSIDLGDYNGASVATEDTINGKGYMPMLLMNGQQDSVRVELAKFIAHPLDNFDAVVLSGSISLVDTEMDFSANDLVLSVAGNSYTVPAEKMIKYGSLWLVKNYTDDSTNGYVTVLINPVRSVFKVIILRTELGDLPDSTSVGIASGNLDLSQDIDLAKNAHGNIAYYPN